MALSIIQCPRGAKLPDGLKAVSFTPQLRFLRFAKAGFPNGRVVCAAFSATGGSGADSNEANPYEIVGVNPLAGFDMVKAAYTKKRRDAEKRGDEGEVAQLEKAYDKIMMSQLSKRKKGETYGSFKVSKDIRYADKLPIIPWGPRPAKSEIKDIRINLAIAAVFTGWIGVTRAAEYKPLQFLGFVFFYRIFEKLKSLEPAASPTFSEDGEDEGRMMRMGKRILRSFALVFGAIAFSSLGFTAVLNLCEIASGFVPAFLYSNQELVVTVSSALMLHVLASYYR